MTQLREDFGVNYEALTLQCISLLHVVLACIATVRILKKRKELNFAILGALLIAWLVPYIGPFCVLLGLMDSRAGKVHAKIA
jgi:hypothetical protein